MQCLSIGVTEARIMFQNCVAARKFEKLEDLDDVVSPLCSDVECANSHYLGPHWSTVY